MNKLIKLSLVKAAMLQCNSGSPLNKDQVPERNININVIRRYLIYLRDNVKLKQKSKTQTLESVCVSTMMTPEVSHPGSELGAKSSELRSLQGH